MRILAPVVACLLTALLLSGCSSAGKGTLQVQATDGPANIDDFSSLIVEVDAIEIKGDAENDTYEPTRDQFDLVQLVNGNTSTIFKGEVDAGNYTKLEIIISKATGTLKTGETVDVKAPKGSLFLTTKFKVVAGEQTDFVFDIHVVKTGNGYNLQPNANGSHASKT